jgi:hypothetical protein
MGVFHHVQKFRVDVGFSLKVKDQKKQALMQFINGFSKKIGFQISRFAGKSPEAAGAFGTAQIAGSGGFDADSDRQSPLHCSAGVF